MNKYFAADTETGRKRFRAGDLFFECNLELSIDIDRIIKCFYDLPATNNTIKELIYYGRDVIFGDSDSIDDHMGSTIATLFVYTIKEIRDNTNSDHLIEPFFVFARTICTGQKLFHLLHIFEHVIYLRQMECL